MRISDRRSRRKFCLPSMSEALKNALDPHHRLLAQAGRADRTDEVTPAPVPAPPWSTRELLIQQQNRQRRYGRYQQVRALMGTGASKAEIARQMGLDHRTVRKFMHAEVFPEAQPRIRRCIVDPYAEYLDRRLLEGCRSPTRLWRELREQGFRGQENIVRYWLLRRRGYRHRAPAVPPQRPALRTSPRQTVWLILKETAAAQSYLEEVCRASPEISVLAQLGREFFRIVRNRDSTTLPDWLAAAKRSALSGFASRLERDQDAVLAALKLPWSNGQVEGQVHRLKLIKRQMYGRAGFDLLRLRVLQMA